MNFEKGNKYMKKRMCIVLCISIFLIFLLTIYQHNIKWRIVNIVEQNIDRYAVVADELLRGTSSTKTSLSGIKHIEGWNDVQVDFTYEYRGFGSKTSYYGFYYSVDDTPRAFQAMNVSFELQGKGMKWNEENSDNWCYVEKIQDNWYYFEIHF